MGWVGCDLSYSTVGIRNAGEKRPCLGVGRREGGGLRVFLQGTRGHLLVGGGLEGSLLYLIASPTMVLFLMHW